MSFNNLISDYKNRIGADGLTIRDQYVNSFKDSLLDSFEDIVEGYPIQYLKNGILTNIGAHIFQYKKKGSSELFDDFRKLILQDFDLKLSLGDIFYFENYYWMVINPNSVKSLSNDMLVRRVNHTLEWVNNSGKVVTEYCICDYNFVYLDAVDSDQRYMRIGDKKRALVIPNNSKTKELKRDKRFIIDDLAYRIDGVDRKTKNLGNGLCLLILEEHQINTSIDLVRNDGTGIADYYNNSIYTIEVLNPSISLSVGQTVQLQYNVKLNGNIVTDKEVTFTQNSNFISISSTGLVTGLANGNTSITVSLAENTNINDTASVVVSTSPSSNYAEEIQGDSSIVINESSDYEIYRLDNGVDTGDVYTFSINSNNASLSVINGNKCTITAKGTKDISVVLAAKNNITLDEFTKTINIVGYW